MRKKANSTLSFVKREGILIYSGTEKSAFTSDQRRGEGEDVCETRAGAVKWGWREGRGAREAADETTAKGERTRGKGGENRYFNWTK